MQLATCYSKLKTRNSKLIRATQEIRTPDLRIIPTWSRDDALPASFFPVNPLKDSQGTLPIFQFSLKNHGFCPGFENFGMQQLPRAFALCALSHSFIMLIHSILNVLGLAYVEPP
jgi:hypothetical protein